MKKLLCLLLALIVLASAGCAAAESESNYSSYAEEPADAADYMYEEGSYDSYDVPAEAPAPEAEETAGTASSSIGGLDEAEYVQNDRKLIYTSEYTIETKAFEKDYSLILDAMEKAGGFVSSENTSGTKPEVYGDAGRTAHLTLRIPVGKYSAFLDGLEGVGSVLSKSRSTEDVTTDYYDNEARIELYEKHYEKLMGYLEKATDMEDIISIEREMNDVLYTIDELKGNKRYMDDRIEYCTAHIYLNEVVEYSEVTATKESFGDRVSESFTSVIKWLGRFFEGFAVVFISALPVLAILAAVFFAIFLPVRAAKRRKKRRQEQNEK